MITDNYYAMWFANQWRAITTQLKSTNIDWSKWKITPAPEGRPNVHK